MKIPFSIAIGLISSALISCGTFEIIVPGESKVVERNISEEYFAIAEVYKPKSVSVLTMFSSLYDDDDNNIYSDFNAIYA